MKGQPDSPDSPDSLISEGHGHFARSNFVEADRLARQCVDAFPDNIDGLILRCRTLSALGQWAEVRDLAISLTGRDLVDPSHLHILITILLGCNEANAAHLLAKKLVGLDPYDPSAQRRLAIACRVVGEPEEAAEAAQAVLKVNPHDYEIVAMRSDIYRATREKNNIAQLEALQSAGCRDWMGEVRVAYALARELEDVGDYDRSFEVLSAGARLRRSKLNYSFSDEIRPLEALGQAFTKDAVAKASMGHENDEPVFILGLPRTGSTLIERIVSSHSEIFNAGELQHFTNAMGEAIKRANGQAGPAGGPLAMIGNVLRGDMAAIGKRYIEMTRPFTGQTPHFIDKLPPNFVHLGFICLALPQAKIIHVKRSPMDACYSIYKFNFSRAYPWSYDLSDIATYYMAYRRLMDHWRALFSDRIIEVAYEDVVEDLEGEARGLIEKLGLKWEAACLDFHKNEAATLTGSASQVRQRIYSSSVGRWRNYEAQLKPLAGALEEAGIDPFNP